MAKSGFLEKQQAARAAYFDAGLQTGRQQILDMVILTLHDPEYMGKDTIGKKRLMRIIKGINDYMDRYELAFSKHAETDYHRAKLDADLADAAGDEFKYSFQKRYSFLPDYDYKTGRWGVK